MSGSVLKAYKRMIKKISLNIDLSCLDRHKRQLLEYHPRSTGKKGISFRYSMSNFYNGLKYVLVHHEK